MRSLRLTQSTWLKKLLSSETELRPLRFLKFPKMKKLLKRVILRKLVVLRTTPTVLQMGAIGRHKIRAKVVFSNTFVLGANLTVMLKRNTKLYIASLSPSSN